MMNPFEDFQKEQGISQEEMQQTVQEAFAMGYLCYAGKGENNADQWKLTAKGVLHTALLPLNDLLEKANQQTRNLTPQEQQEAAEAAQALLYGLTEHMSLSMYTEIVKQAYEESLSPDRNMEVALVGLTCEIRLLEGHLAVAQPMNRLNTVAMKHRLGWMLQSVTLMCLALAFPLHEVLADNARMLQRLQSQSDIQTNQEPE